MSVALTASDRPLPFLLLFSPLVDDKELQARAVKWEQMTRKRYDTKVCEVHFSCLFVFLFFFFCSLFSLSHMVLLAASIRLRRSTED